VPSGISWCYVFIPVLKEVHSKALVYFLSLEDEGFPLAGLISFAKIFDVGAIYRHLFFFDHVY